MGSDGHDWEIFLWDGTQTVQLTSNYYDDGACQIDAGQVVWSANDGHDGEIFLWDGSQTIKLTSNDYDDLRPQIDAGRVLWEGYDGHDWEIFLINLESYTPTGTNIKIRDSLTHLAVKFVQVTTEGNTTIAKTDTGPEPPAGLQVVGAEPYYDITTTASYTGSITVAIPYDEAQLTLPENESELQMQHWDMWAGKWNNVTTEVNTTEKIVYGSVMSLSIFAIMEPTNQPPTVGNIIAPLDPLPLGTAVDVSAIFTDPNAPDIHTAEWDWGDGSTSDGDVEEANGSGTVDGSHTYAEAGVYTITLTVYDDDGGEGQSIFQFVVVYDPEGSFVTGGGWINSPAGAYATDPTLTGKATFGFVSKYQKGKTTPTGNTEFQFKAGDLNFHSDTYEWLVVAGARAKYKGTGTVNGEGNYGFMLTAIDAKLTPSTDVDKFRIKIWNKDTDTIVYDNQMGDADDAEPATGIGGGSIVIHKG